VRYTRLPKAHGGFGTGQSVYLRKTGNFLIFKLPQTPNQVKIALMQSSLPGLFCRDLSRHKAKKNGKIKDRSANNKGRRAIGSMVAFDLHS
jgi:hypothetical protein